MHCERLATTPYAACVPDSPFMFYDYETDSLWVQATGEAVWGPFKGTRLERLPATQTTWSSWRKAHPETRVLGREMSRTTAYWHDSFTLNYETGKEYPLKKVVTPDVPLSYVVADKMRLNKDKTELRVTTRSR